MRITTNAMVRDYNSSLSLSLTNLDTARQRVYTKRRFFKASQDPAGAMRATQLQQKYLRTEDYIDTVETIQKRQDTADDTLQQIIKLTNDALNSDSLKASNDTNIEQRQTFATTLRGVQSALLQFANTTFEEKYLFAGADGNNLPFSMDDDGTVRYRGLDVSDPLNKLQLEALAKEKLYVDIGLGVTSATGTPAQSSDDINAASAFDISLPGPEIFGFGTVAGSNPPISANIIELLGQMADELEKTPLDQDRFGDMQLQLKKNYANMVDYNAGLGIRDNFLESTHSRLEDSQLSIYTQLDKVENMDPAEAIMDYSYSQYAYNMILKVGTDLLSYSFIDYMK